MKVKKKMHVRAGSPPQRGLREIKNAICKICFNRRPAHAASRKLAKNASGTLASVQMRLRALLLVWLLPVMFTGCAKRKKTWRTPPPPGKYVETGIASWYGYPYHGRPTASGEVYDMNKLTAAHRKLPFNTWVRVENLANRRKVDVRINDRGPFVRGRIIDLSRAAAVGIDMLGSGTAKVRLTSIRPPKRELDAAGSAPPPRAPQEGAPPEPSRRPSPFPPASVEHSAGRPLFAVQVGAFSARGRAERVCERLKGYQASARVIEKPGDPPLWCVLAGEFPDAAQAAAFAGELQKEFPGAFAVRLDEK